MNLGMVISSPVPEVQWNAFRFANLILNEMHEVTIFLNGPAVEFRKNDSPDFPLEELAKIFTLSEGVLLA